MGSWVLSIEKWNKVPVHFLSLILSSQKLSTQSACWAKVNQQSPMQQLVVLSFGWATFFHSTQDGVHQSPFPFATSHCIFFHFHFVLSRFSPVPNLTHSYLIHLLTFISITPTLVPYLLFPTNIAILITNYPIDLATILTTYPTNMATLLITYLINLITILITYPTNLVTLYTQPPYWHKYFTNLVTLISNLFFMY